MAREYSTKLALIDGDIVLTYAQLAEEVESFAGALTALSLTSDSKLGILCLNQKENLIALLGGFLSGVPVVPMNPLLTLDDLIFITKDAGIDNLLISNVFVKPEIASFAKLFKTIIVTDSQFLAFKLANVTTFKKFLENAPTFFGKRKRKEDDPDILLYTSGTTARPKGVPLREEQFFDNTGAFLDHLELSQNDRCIVALPMFHSFGNIMVLSLLRVGGTIVFVPQFQPKTILAKIAEHKATVLPLVPTIYAFLVELAAKDSYNISSLRLCISGGASLPEALLKKVEKTLGVTVLEGYGLTETAPVISVNRMKDGSVPGSVGPVLSNLEIKIVDESGKPLPRKEIGEILVKGSTVMKGYWHSPEETKQVFTEDGWFCTGDLGHLDERDFLYISAGRKKDLIIRAGENISPLAVENTLMNHPFVREVSVVGVSDPRVGERVKACVILLEGVSATEADIKEFCRKKLPLFMKPDIVRFYKAFPKTATGKVIKAQLREDL